MVLQTERGSLQSINAAHLISLEQLDNHLQVCTTAV
jgi:hypothetical protein